ncbi:rhodanese-like domain-containing protein [Paramaledivibacter caminithermalis]|uniref:Rhodanese-related sulfurtransferase n=1 Tax=Paramaledivibacter caminithermalis (strain DSM 15212 / CIP 107654 / DViRD3) TaxID=1121301 RepID=A0A1M6SGE3_PARC5|nr:rhodanese-like domain-containing protein [Paramaledivibacter caminithermalis]SHK43730.1 Rhodanese-related sulfurtransferase [Paramaledivibacter caminithermalis DSM 15212]
MLRVLIIKKKHLYIVFTALLVLIIGITLLMFMSKSNETFSESLKYAYKKISPEQAKMLINNNNDLTVLDVRSEREYLDGHIPNAVLIPYKLAKNNYSSLLERGKKYLVYCDTGKKSEKIAKTLSSNGFSRIYLLAGGIEKWNYDLVR